MPHYQNLIVLTKNLTLLMIKKLLVIFIIKLTLISNLKNMQNHKAYVCNYPLNLCNLGSKFSVSYKIKSQLRVSLNFYSHV